MSENNESAVKILVHLCILPFMPSYYLTKLLTTVLREISQFRGREAQLAGQNIPTYVTSTIVIACLAIIFNLWVVLAVFWFQPLIHIAAQVRPLFPHLAWKLVSWQHKMVIIFDMKGPHEYVLLWWLVFLPSPIFFFYILFSRPPEHPLQKSLDRYKCPLPEKPVDMVKVYKEAKAAARKEQYDFTFLGHNYKSNTPAIITDQERLRHVQIIGGTGSGKTSSILFPMMKQDIERGRGLVFADAKGDLMTAKTVYQMAREAGREKDVQIFSMSFPEKSRTYNPLALGNATQLKDKIIGAMEFSEPHYKRECESGLQTLFGEVLEKAGTKGTEAITLSKLNEHLMEPTNELPKFSKFYHDHKKNISGIQNEISLMMNTPFSKLFDGNEINLLKAYDEKKIVYFALNVLTYGETGKRLGRLITGDLNTLCGMVQNREQRDGFGVYIDEYGAFGTESFGLTLSQGRSAKFMVTIAHQSKADLKAISPHHDEQIKSNTNTRIVLRSSNVDGEDFCNEIGTYRDIEKTRQIAITGAIEGAEMGSEKVIDVYHINPQEVRQLRTGQAAYRTPTEHGLVQLNYFGYSKEVLKEIVLPDRERIPEIPVNTPEVPEIKVAQRVRDFGPIFDL